MFRARRVDDFGIDARAHRFQNRFACSFGGQIDGAGPIEVERNAGLVRGDQGKNHVAHVATRQIMRLEWIAVDVQAGFHGCDPIVNN